MASQMSSQFQEASSRDKDLYDQITSNGLTVTNGIDRRTGTTDPAGAEAWSYDATGRVLNDQRTTKSGKSLIRMWIASEQLPGTPWTP
jgi:YD repeat-containing protein